MMTETFINETYGINGITRISLKKIIEVFSFPNEININFSNKEESINIKFIYDGLEVNYMLYFFSENIEKPEYQTLYFDVKYVHLNDDSIKIGDEIKTVIPKIKKILKEYQKKSDFRYSEDKYTGRYLFDNGNIDIFFQKYRNKKIVDGIMISLPYEDILPENKEVLNEIKNIIEIKNKIDNFFLK